MPARTPELAVVQGRWLIQFTSLSSDEIRTKVGVSKKTVERWRASLECYGTMYPPAIAKAGRPRALTEEQEEVKLVSSYALAIPY
jgi:transposase